MSGSKTRWGTRLVGAVLLSMGGVAGCGGEGSTTECAQLIQVVNKGGGDLDQLLKDKRGEDAAEGLRKVAGLLERASTSAAALELADQGLAGFAKRYVVLTKSAAKASHDMAGAIDAKDTAAMESAQEAMETVVAGEDPLLDDINAHCGG